ncbi:MAG: polysaccharide deacetylase [Hyphomicrobiales bacterium]|nr:polysaccharide deacetylase [Hyphomicrobiales bacterium]MBV9906303.1 polysaccharide deacetylase [Hyphomicrobiales bacterium]
MITAAACAALSGAARAADCAFTPASATRLQSLTAVSDYTPVLKACVAADGRKAVAIREMTVGGQKVDLLADPEALTTRLERAACWTCREESEAELGATRMGRAIRESAQAPGLVHRGFLQNAGLIHGGGQGDFVTGDLCPSQKPLVRSFFTRLEAASPHAPVALSISGLWLIHHFDDFRWLVDQRNAGALDILWTDHTYHHPYHRKLPDDANFLLSKGVDPQEEILDTERLLIANGETPSLFFRFPGLISSDPLMQAVRQYHLITLGADAWLALGEKPGHGSIVLVHPNGNEPKGLAMFSTDLAHGEIAAPLEPLTAAPE